ncbi:MAG: hypothetical protein N2383_10080 [Caldilineales bacterium]|nr:hypothetical protein [Caldilineales bacterium]
MGRDAGPDHRRDDRDPVEGTWETIGSRLRQRYEGLLDRVTLYWPFVPGERDDAWRRLVRCWRM